MKVTEMIHMGYCNSAHGIRGDFSFTFFNSESRHVQKNSKIFLKLKNSDCRIDSEIKEYSVVKISYGNKVIASLEGVYDRGTVESMIPFDIFIDKKELSLLSMNEYYVRDLLGLDAFCFDNEEFVGKVVSFYENGANLVLVIKFKEQEIDILFIDQFIKHVDLENNKIIVVLPKYVE